MACRGVAQVGRSLHGTLERSARRGWRAATAAPPCVRRGGDDCEGADGGWADVGDMRGVTSADAASACWASRLYLVAARCLFLRCVSSSCSESAIRLRLYFWCSLLKFQCGTIRTFWLIVFSTIKKRTKLCAVLP